MCSSDLRRPQELTLHREKGDLAQDVPRAQRRRKLDGVEDGERFRQADVFRLQIAVAVDDPAGADPLAEKPRLTLQVLQLAAAQSVCDAGGDQLGIVGDRFEVSQDVLPQRLMRCMSVDPGSSACVRVKGDQQVHQTMNVLFRRGTFGDAVVEHRVVRQTLHLDAVLDDRLFARRFRDDARAGFPWMQARRDAAANDPIERAGELVRAWMPWLSNKETRR